MRDPLTSTGKILMGKAKKKRPNPGTTIALNKKARFEYVLAERLEAGLVLEGWEVKSLRDRRIQFAESYVMLKDGEAFLFGALISPLLSASTHIKPEPTRTRKLLLHARELKHLIGAVERKGFTLVPTAMYWKNGRVKVEIALAKGKHTHDKRKTERDRDWQRDQRRILKGTR